MIAWRRAQTAVLPPAAHGLVQCVARPSSSMTVRVNRMRAQRVKVIVLL
jgi:hypothetical protein